MSSENDAKKLIPRLFGQIKRLFVSVPAKSPKDADLPAKSGEPSPARSPRGRYEGRRERRPEGPPRSREGQRGRSPGRSQRDEEPYIPSLPDDGARCDALEKRIEYRFKDRFYLLKALTHSSFAHENDTDRILHNERLEFLGDAILDLIVSEYLFKAFPDDREGALTQKRSNVVSTAGLLKKATALELHRFLRLGRGEEKTGGRSKKTIVTDALEALIAAVYLDGGYDAAKGFVMRTWQEELDRDLSKADLLDYMSLLQTISQEQFNCIPRYKQITERGPSHERTFTVKVMLDGKSYGVGEGPTKKGAKKMAAKAALARLAPELKKEDF